jgi:hypothetical protein
LKCRVPALAGLQLALAGCAHHAGLVIRGWTGSPVMEQAGGKGRVLIASNRRSVANLGTGVGVAVFTAVETLAFLGGRMGLADPAGAAAAADQLGYLPLALAQAAAVIAGQ